MTIMSIILCQAFFYEKNKKNIITLIDNIELLNGINNAYDNYGINDIHNMNNKNNIDKIRKEGPSICDGTGRLRLSGAFVIFVFSTKNASLV